MWRLTGVVWAQAWFKLARSGTIDQTIVRLRRKADISRSSAFVWSAFDLPAGASIGD
jgi:hypothetical protein